MPKAGRFAFMSDEKWDQLEEQHRKLLTEIKKQQLKPDPRNVKYWTQNQCQQYLNRNR